MAMSDYSLSDIAAITEGGGNRNNGGFGDGNGAWWLLVLFALLGGFGNNRGFGGGQGGGYGAGNIGGNEIYPWLNQAQLTNDGFRDQMIQTNIQGIQQGINSLSTQLCNCCGDMQMSLANGFAGVEQGANARQMASMQQAFAQQMATSQGFNGLQAQLAECCCENRLATANQTATILAENCADRAAVSDGVRDLLTAGVANTQRIVDTSNANYRQLFDWLANKELRDEQRENDHLRQRISSLELAASQLAQNNQIVDSIYNRLATCPVGTQPIYGNQPIFTCQPQNNGCGCGCGCGN